MERKGYLSSLQKIHVSSLLASLILFTTGIDLHARSKREQADLDKKKVSKEMDEKEARFQDPNAPQVVRKTFRHPLAKTLEVDYD